MASQPVRRRVVISGRVQGVWFRDSCRRHAEEVGVSGWVANRLDGSVEAAFEGDPNDVERIIAWCRIGPPRADVVELRVTEEPVEGLVGFRVR